MAKNLSFSFDADGIFARIDAETSRHAAFLRFQDGGSAYDALKIHTQDKPAVNGFVADAFRTLVTRFGGEVGFDSGYTPACPCSGSQEKWTTHELSFYLPDFDDSLYETAHDEIARYVVLSSTARWLMMRSFGEYAKMVAGDSDASLNRAVEMLRTRKYPFD